MIIVFLQAELGHWVSVILFQSASLEFWYASPWRLSIHGTSIEDTFDVLLGTEAEITISRRHRNKQGLSDESTGEDDMRVSGEEMFEPLSKYIEETWLK